MRLDAAAPVLRTPIGERDHLIGSLAAPVNLVEYGDFQCPHCAKAAGIVSGLLHRFGDRICYAFRNFPLVKLHPMARHAAEAAEAAGAQGKYWEMHRFIFEHQIELSIAKLTELAASLNLDMTRFDHDTGSHVFAGRLQEDLSDGLRSGVNGTPTFFVNGRRRDGYDRESLTQAIAQAAPAS